MSMEKTNTKRAEFLFQRPEYVNDVCRASNVVLAMGALASRMTQEERTRNHHPDGRRENVAEHSFMLAKVSLALADEMYPWMDRGKIAIAALGHDDVEAYVGDTPTDPIANHDPLYKEKLEATGLMQLAAEYQALVPRYVNDVITYEHQEEYEAQFVRIVDKMMVLVTHIPNQGHTLREHYTYEQFEKNTHAKELELLDQYPHFIEVIGLRTELALYVGKKYVRDWHS